MKRRVYIKAVRINAVVVFLAAGNRTLDLIAIGLNSLSCDGEVILLL